MADRIVLIGGSNVDYIAESNKKLIRRDSNPGKITTSFGGVGRNVVENLARLGNKITFITGIGNDLFGEEIVAQLEKMSVKVVYPEPHVGSSSYIAINDAGGDMDVAVCDSRAIDSLGIDFIKKHDSELRQREYLVLETNLSSKTIADLMHTYPDKKWMVEAVSTGKVKKLRKYLDRVYLFKGNLMEAVEVAQSESSDIEKVVKALLEKGIKNVVVTQGANDVWYGNEKGIGKIPVIPAEKIVNTTGAGDAMFAGIVDQINSGHTLEEAIVFGMKLSSLTLQSVKAVAEEVDGLKYEH